MATTASRIFIPGRARVYLGPVGTIQPIDPNAPYDPALIEVGHFSDDSLSFATDPTFEEVRSHQSDYAVRRYQTEDNATLEVDLHEWSASNFQAVFGGGNVTSIGPGLWKYTPPALGGRGEVMCVVKCTDGYVAGGTTPRSYAFVIPRAMQVEGIDTSLNKSENAILPLRLSVLGADVGDAWYMITSDDPAWSTTLPTLTSRTPATGLDPAGGTPVTITGTGLATLTNVLFGESGVATGGTATTLTDTAASFEPDAFAGGSVDITGGTGAGQTQPVTGNTATGITVGSWTTTPDATSVYQVYKPATSFFVNGAGTQISATAPAMPSGSVLRLFLPNNVGATVNGGVGSTVTYS